MYNIVGFLKTYMRTEHWFFFVVPKPTPANVVVKDEKMVETRHPVTGAVKKEDPGTDSDEEWWSKNADEVIEMCKAYD